MSRKPSKFQTFFTKDAGTGIELAPNETKLLSKQYEPASFPELLRYADSKDYMLLAGGILGSLLTGILNPFVAFIMTDMNSAMIGAQNAININPDTFDVYAFKASIFSVVVRIAANGFAMLIGAYISMTCFYHLCERQIHKIRKHFLYAIMHQDMEWFDKNQVGTLTQKMSSGIDRIKDGMSDKIGVIIHAVISLISGCIIGFCLSWKMTLIMMLMAPCVILSLYFNARALRRAIRIEMTAYGIAGAIATEVLSGIRTVLSFNAQNFEIERYKNCLKKARRLGIKKATVTGICTGIFLFFMNLAMGVGFYFGSIFAFNGEMDVGAVIGVFWAVMLGAMRLGQAVPNMNVILAAKLAAGEIFSIIDRKPKIDCATDAGLKPKTVQGNISFRDIHFSYPTRPNIKILDGVSFDIKAGQKVAFCGHSGCGKSTTIGLLMRFYSAMKGSITLDDIPLEDLNISWLRENIGIVSQEPVLFAATIEENLKMGEKIPQQVLEEACKTANALDFIQKLPNGFQTLIGEGGIKLSGGQKQRIAIARALIRNPKILLLDEATSALDSESEMLVQSALDQASKNRTTISIAHRLSTIMNSDVIFVFDKGQIVEFGDHETLLNKNGIYSNLVGAQQIEKKKDESDDEFESADEGFDRADVKNTRNSLEARESARRARASERLSKSITNVNNDNAEIADVEEDVHEEGAAAASILEILKFSKLEWKFIFSGFFGAIFTGLRIPFYSLLVGQLFISLGLTDSEVAMYRIFWILIGFTVLGVVSAVACFFGGLLFGIAGEKMSSRLRMAVFKNLLRQDGYYFDMPSHSVGKLTMRLATDAHNVQAAVDQRLCEVIQGLTGLIGGIVVAFSSGPSVAPICMIWSVVLVVIQITISNYLKRRGTKDMQAAELASKIANESIENIRTVQALARQKTLFDAFCNASIEPRKRALVRGYFQSFLYALGISFSALNFAVCYTFGALLIAAGYTTPAILFQVIESLNIAAIIIIATSNYFPEYLKARLSAGLMFQMMNEHPKIDAFNEGGLKPDLNGSVSLQKVSFSYPNSGKQLILNHLSFTVPAGKTVALCGPSGSGKSTVIQLLERFYDVFDGSVCVDKFDVKQLNIHWLRSLSAVVGQEPTLFNLTVRENIAYGMPQVTETQIYDAAKLANIHNFIESLPEKYNTNIGGKGAQLSGGQRQRLAIARAIIRDPKILLLDEATSALDTESEKIVQEALEKARQGRTCVIVAHRLSTIQHADLIVVIKDGKVVEIGNHQQLLSAQGLYYNMVLKQQMN